MSLKAPRDPLAPCCSDLLVTRDGTRNGGEVWGPTDQFGFALSSETLNSNDMEMA